MAAVGAAGAVPAVSEPAMRAPAELPPVLTRIGRVAEPAAVRALHLLSEVQPALALRTAERRWRVGPGPGGHISLSLYLEPLWRLPGGHRVHPGVGHPPRPATPAAGQPSQSVTLRTVQVASHGRFKFHAGATRTGIGLKMVERVEIDHPLPSTRRNRNSIAPVSRRCSGAGSGVVQYGSSRTASVRRDPRESTPGVGASKALAGPTLRKLCYLDREPPKAAPISPPAKPSPPHMTTNAPNCTVCLVPGPPAVS